MARKRITITDLRAAVDLLNTTTGNKPGAVGSYVLGRVVTYALGKAYVRWQLQQFATNGSLQGITFGYIPARELHNMIHAFRHGYAQRRSELAQSDECLAVFIPAADAKILLDALATAAERESSDGEHDDDDDQAEHHRECASALDQLADAITAALRQKDSAL
jgi:hypothetical protein